MRRLKSMSPRALLSKTLSQTLIRIVLIVTISTVFGSVWHLLARTPPPQAKTDSRDAVVSPQTRRLITPIASMIDVNTFFIGHIDLSKIEPETAAAHLKISTVDIFKKLRSNKALSEAFTEGELAAAMRLITQSLDRGTEIAQSKCDELRSLGCNEIYVLANSKIMTVSAIQVVCIAPANNLAKLEKALVLPDNTEFGWVFQHDGDKLIANLIVPFSTTSINDANVGNRVAFQHRLIRPSLRPELLAGLERVKDTPVKLVFAPDGVLKGMAQSMPMMTSRIYGGSLMQFAYPNMKSLEDGIRWLAIGLDPSRPMLTATIQSKSPEAAQELLDTVIRQKIIFSTILGMDQRSRRNNPYGYNNHRIAQIISGLDFAMLFLPEVHNDRLELVIDEKRLAETTELITSAYTNVILPTRESAGKKQCSNNMKQIILAMHNYHDANRAFPAPYTTDKNGRPLHSWRVALLPYMEQTALYGRIMQRRDEPWDSDYHKQFHNVNVPVYQCPAAKNQKPGMTNYSVVVGKVDAEKARQLGLPGSCATAFPEPNKWYSISHLTDGTSNTIGIVERKEPVCWMDPTQDITLEEAIRLYQSEQAKVGSAHKGGFFVGICDGSVQFWDTTQRTLEQWKAALTANGGESLSLY